MKINQLSHLLTAFTLLTSFPVAHAGTLGTAFTYQGQLLTGGLAANGIYDLRFTIYDALADGNPVGGPLTNSAVAVAGGLFTRTIDFGSGVFTGEARWLEIAVRTNGGSAFTTLAPRQPLVPAPYALFAPIAATATKADSATSAITSASFSGPLAGDVTGTQAATVVARVGSQIAADVASGVTAANAATSANTPGALVKRDGAGGFAAGTISAANLTGNGAGLTNLNASQLSSGTVADNRLAGNIARTDKVWLLGGNGGTVPGAQFLGTTDNQALELRVNGTRALRLEPNASGAPNIIGGAPVNSVAAGVRAATISGGGGTNSGGTLWRNTVGNDFGTIAGGGANTIETSALGGTIGGGALNVLRYNWGTIAGGYDNQIDIYANSATIAGGVDNRIGSNAGCSALGGGNGNNLQGPAGTIAGGEHNTIGPDAGDSVIAGGGYNSIQGFNYASAIGGGSANFIQTNSLSSTIAGGSLNTIEMNAQNSTITGGDYNRIQANAWHATIGGGGQNTASATSATVAGGYGNTAGRDSVVGGGFTNSALGVRATVPGGHLNEAKGDYSFAAGRRAKANHAGSFVWADSTDADFASAGNDQFLVRAGGGVGIGTNNPAGAALNVAGAVWANTFRGDGSGLTGLSASQLTGTMPTASANNVIVDPNNMNSGTLAPGLTFGAGSGEGIASKRDAGGNQYGLDFFTGFSSRMKIFNWGAVNIGGTNPPDGQLEVASGGWAPQLRVTQNDNGNWARITMGVAGSTPWTLSVGSGPTPAFNFWNGSANVAVLDYSGNLWIQGLYQGSDRNTKTNFTEVQPQAILQRVLALPLQRWTFTNDLNATHLGPMAQDFHAAFGLGADDKHIATVDADGVALAAIQGLNQKLEERDARILALEKTVSELKAVVAKLATSSSEP